MEKDLCLKRYLYDDERFADLINGFVGGGKQLIAPSDLTDMDSQTGYHRIQPQSGPKEKQVRGSRRSKYHDLIKKAAFGMNFIVVGLEAQEKTHYLMPLRCMAYDTAEYERQAAQTARKVKKARNITAEEFLSGFRKSDRLHPCMTLVLYFGGDWDGARSIQEILDFSGIPKELKDYVNDYRIHLIDVRNLSSTEMFRTDLRQVFDSIRYAEDPLRFQCAVNDDPAFQCLSDDAYDVIARYTNAADLIAAKKNYMDKEGRVNMCKALTELIQNGKAEGKAEVVLEFLSEIEAVPEALKSRILGERDLDTLKGWVKLAASVESIEAFTARM